MTTLYTYGSYHLLDTDLSHEQLNLFRQGRLSRVQLHDILIARDNMPANPRRRERHHPASFPPPRQTRSRPGAGSSYSTISPAGPSSQPSSFVGGKTITLQGPGELSPLAGYGRKKPTARSRLAGSQSSAPQVDQRTYDDLKLNQKELDELEGEMMYDDARDIEGELVLDDEGMRLLDEEEQQQGDGQTHNIVFGDEALRRGGALDDEGELTLDDILSDAGVSQHQLSYPPPTHSSPLIQSSSTPFAPLQNAGSGSFQINTQGPFSVISPRSEEEQRSTGMPRVNVTPRGAVTALPQHRESLSPATSTFMGTTLVPFKSLANLFT